MGATGAYLAGVPLLDIDTVSWKLQKGVFPYQRLFEVPERFAKAIMDASNKDVSLVIEPDGKEPTVINGLYVLSTAPGSHPERISVLVSDVRWKWNRKHIIRRYNVRRRTGQRRLLYGQGDLDPLASSTPDITYAKYSLKEEKQAWNARDVIHDVLAYVTEDFFEDKEVDVIYDVKSGNVEYPNSVSVEGLELDDSGPYAIQRVLSYCPGLDVYIDDNGMCQIVQTNDSSEEKIYTAIKDGKVSEVAGPPLITHVSLRRTRPKSIDVYFTCEDEIRFDFIESEQANKTPSEKDRIIENVIEVTDGFIDIDGKRYVQGEYVKIDEKLFTEWNKRPPTTNTGASLPSFNSRVARETWFYGGYSFYLNSDLEIDQIWGRRISAFKKHYRQTFRINKGWMDRLRSIKNYRVSVIPIDPTTGTMARAAAYVDYAVIPTFRSVSKTNSDHRLVVFNRDGYPDQNSDILLDQTSGGYTLSQQQALVEIVDEELGIIRLNYQQGVYATDAEIVPSKVIGRNSREDPAMHDPRDELKYLSDCVLSEDHKVAIVLTTAPASPNDLRQCYKITINPNDLSQTLPSKLFSKIQGADGPTMEVHVGAGVDTARFAWLDQYDDEIEDSIINGSPRVENCLINRESLELVAKAYAATIYVSLADRFEGNAVVPIQSKAGITGRIGSVEHELMPDGVATTTYNLDPDYAPIDFWSLVPESVRRILRREVQKVNR